VARGECCGVLAVERVGELPPGERLAMVALGAHLGLALDNARLAARQRRFAEELAAEVQAVARARASFVAIASHELRTPLTALLGFAELLARRRVAPDEVPRVAAIVWHETERLARIVDDVLDLSRIEQGMGLRLRRVAVAPGPAVAAAVEVLAGAARAPRIVVDCPEGLPPVDADPDALDRILKNVVGNALKYSPPSSRVRVRLRPGPGTVEFAVEDTGRGIPPEVLPRVFEPYYRAPDAAGAARGAGLGLAVVKALVDAHGGAVRVASAPGAGTCVTFALPAAP
jgi:signal transduction histidine kinase